MRGIARVCRKTSTARTKKQVNDGELLALYHEREIWWVHLGVNVG
jgi:hypothetical protein